MVWMALFWFVVKVVLSFAISYALAPKAGTPDGAVAAGLDAFTVPTAIVGREIPVLFGTKLLSGPNCVWSGGLKIVAIEETIDGGLLHSDSHYTIAHEYSLGMHLILAHEIDSIFQIEVDEKVVWAGSTTGGEIYVNARDIFGGVKSGGGIQGYVDFENGNASQTQNAYLQSKLGTDIPAFRNVAAVVLKTVYLGTNPNLLPWAFWCKKIPNSWYPAKAEISGEANAAHIIYETITNKSWGMRFNAEDIDEAAFTAVADTLFTEDFGISVLWDHSSRLEDFLLEILKHIDASLYISRTTGQFTLKLIREDYDVETIPVFDESNITKVSRFKRRGPTDLINSVSVKYWDASTGKQGSTSVHDAALVATMGGTVTQAIDYTGVTTHALAAKLAMRDLRALSSPLADCELYVNREGATLNIGDTFIMSWPRYGIDEIVMRITGVEFGEFGNSAIRVECIEDFYGVDEAIYSTPPSSLWVSPVNDPAPCPVHSAIEAPFYTLSRETELSPTEIAALDPSGGFACVAGAKPTSDAIDSEAWFNDGTGYARNTDTTFTPRGILTSDIGILDTVLSLTLDSLSSSIILGSWAIIDSEIVRVDAVGATTITVGRGCLDTVPVEHLNTANVLFVQGNYAMLNNLLTGNVYAKLLPRTGKGNLAIADAPEQIITINDRINRPYPPAQLLLNSMQEPVDITGTIIHGWVHRDRLQQVDSVILDTSSAGVGPEVGTTYSYDFRRADTDALLYNASGITGLTATTTSFDIGYEGLVKYHLWSVRDGAESWQQHEREFFYFRAEMRTTEDGTARVTEDGIYRIVEL